MKALNHSGALPLRAAALVLWLSGCSSVAPDQAGAASSRPVGALVLELSLPDLRIDDLEFSVVREDTIKRRGTFVVEGFQGTFRAVLGALPEADDYSLSLSGSARDANGREMHEDIDCSGFAAFGVSRAQTTAISLRLYCGDAPPAGARPGPMPNTDGKGDGCPHVEAIQTNPQATAVGGEIKLMAVVTHLDRVPAVIYAWSSDSGTFTQALSGVATFKCTQSGIATITLDISFTDGERTCPKRSGEVEIECRPAMDGASGAAAGRGTGGSGGAAR